MGFGIVGYGVLGLFVDLRLIVVLDVLNCLFCSGFACICCRLV